MRDSHTSLESLLRGSGVGAKPAVPRPPARWFLRFMLPVLIVAAAAAMLAYAMRDALIAHVEVDVVPVVTKGGSAAASDWRNDEERSAGRSREPAVIAQAPGWIEPDPYAVTVQPLVPGVVGEVLVLEGERVEQGQVVARLVAEDAELSLRGARAELRVLQAAAERAQAAIEVAEARLDEIIDEVERKRELVELGGISPGEYARLQHRLRSQRAEVGAARAGLRQAEAQVERHRVIVEEHELALDRTVIRAPVAGVVLTRSVVPGTRVALAGDGVGEAHFPGLIRLYDPATLQVRADVPLADAARIGVGTLARITTEALPDRTFLGQVTRIVHQADIQRNTVQVKVRIDEPSAQLKPDMLTRVRFLGQERPDEEQVAQDEETGATARAVDQGSLRLYIPHHVIQMRAPGDGERARVWVVHRGSGGRSFVAGLHDITLGHSDGDFMLVQSGLRPGDRLITNPSAKLRSGARVRIRQDQVSASRDMEGR
jgi:HlyD family secretion protein